MGKFCSSGLVKGTARGSGQHLLQILVCRSPSRRLPLAPFLRLHPFRHQRIVNGGEIELRFSSACCLSGYLQPFVNLLNLLMAFSSDGNERLI